MSNEKEKNPWHTLNTEIVYESPWIKVSKSAVKNPAGNDGIYSVVHFKNLAIGVLPLDEENNTWLVGQYRYPTNSYSWEICEGGGDPQSDPLESAKRELKEETGIIAGKYQEIMRLHLSNSATDEYAIVFAARNLSFVEAEPEESEVLQVKKIHINDAFDLCMKGEITDAITVAAIFKTKHLLDSNQLRF
jgi:8-oxo-dGTP pyrophosphatase MutT (NUDIX family)